MKVPFNKFDKFGITLLAMLIGLTIGLFLFSPPYSVLAQVLTPAPNTIDNLGAVGYCADAGSTDAYACSYSPAPPAYVTGNVYRFKANTVNTGAATINFNSISAKTIVKYGSGSITTALADGDIRAGQMVMCIYDGTNMQLISAH